MTVKRHVWQAIFAFLLALLASSEVFRPIRAEPRPDSERQPTAMSPKPLEAGGSTPHPPNLASEHMVWNFGLSGTRNFLKSIHGHYILGSHGAVQFGAGYITPRWFAFTSLDFHTGPFEPVTVGEVDVDYMGTGFTAWSGISPQTNGLRQGGLGYGLALGVSYIDLVGRSIGYGTTRGTNAQDPQGLTGVSAYTLETTNVSVTPGIFLSYLEKPRLSGNHPELLTTRFEGHILTLGAALPVIAEFKKKTNFSDGTNAVENGPMRVYRIDLTWTALLAP
jgi:hypothetical protein